MKKLTLFLASILCTVGLFAKVQADPTLYIIGEVEGATWSFSAGLQMDYADGIFTKQITANGSFSFATQFADSWDNFKQYRWAATENQKDISDGNPAQLSQSNPDNAFKLTGVYDLKVDWAAKTVTATKVGDLAPEVLSGDLYLITSSGSWDVSKGEKCTYTDATKLYTATLTLNATDNFIVPSTKLGASAADWDGISLTRYGAESDAAQALADGVATAMKKSSDKAFKLGAGKYEIVIDATQFTITATKKEDVEPQKEGFGIQINGETIVDGVKGEDKTYDNITYQEYAVLNVELKKDDKVRAYDLKNAVPFSIALDAAVTAEVATKTGDDIIIAADGKYDFYLKIASGHDNVWIQKASNEQPVVKEAGYYIAGQKALLGEDWKVADANLMTLNDEGTIATLVKENISLTTGEYGYKVVEVKDGAQTWIPDGEGNEPKLAITENAIYKVTFTFEIAKGAEGIAAVAEKTGEYVEPQPAKVEHLYILGSVNDQQWAPNAGIEMTAGENNIFTLKATVKGYFSFSSMLAADAEDWAAIKDYRFVPDNLESDVTLEDGVPAKIVSNYVDDPKAFTATSAEYTITVDMNAMTVTLKMEGEPITPPQPTTDTKVYVMGEIEANGASPWGANIGKEMTFADGKYTLVANITGYFCFTTMLAATADAWADIAAYRLGGETADIEAAAGTEYTMTQGSDQSWKIAAAGTYTITLDLENLKFTLTEGGTLPPDDNKDALDNVQVTLDTNAPMYNTLGQPVNADYRGIVIQNGHKFLLK